MVLIAVLGSACAPGSESKNPIKWPKSWLQVRPSVADYHKQDCLMPLGELPSKGQFSCSQEQFPKLRFGSQDPFGPAFELGERGCDAGPRRRDAQVLNRSTS